MASIDITEEVRKHIGSEPIPKIDPNTQEPASIKTFPDSGNGIIPALLVGFYKHSRNEQQAGELIKENNADNVLLMLFSNKKNDIIRSVSNYAGMSEIDTEAEMKNTAAVIKEVICKEVKKPDGKNVSTFFTTQRSNILKHLPVELNMGELMNDASVDDRTNKMEGPVSGIMHTVEKIFSSTK